MISLSDSFFEDEIREGFYVPSEIKQAWGAQLTVLNEVERVCKKHGLLYFACWGTLLGAIRHGGIIPWDDDFDILMRRKDYDVFMSVWQEEMPDGYDVICYRTNPNNTEFIANVVGKSRACFEKDHLEMFHGFPYIAGIDIFVIDNMDPDEEKEKQRMKNAMLILAVADGIYDGTIKGEAVESNIRKIEQICGTKINRNLQGVDFRIYLYTVAERYFAAVPDEAAKTMTQVMPWGMKGRPYIFNRSDVERSIDIPFETGSISVCPDYLKQITMSYGDYMRIYKDIAGHNYPFFDKQKEDLQKLLDFEMPGYRFSESELIRPSAAPKEKSYKAVTGFVAAQMTEMCKKIAGLCDDEVIGALENIQQTAIELGTYIERIKGEGYITVKRLEEMCEGIYRLSNDFSDSKLLERIITISEQVEEDIRTRKEVVFMPFKADYWGTMESEYNRALADPNADVYVVALPYYYKNYDGTLRDMQLDVSGYPDGLNMIDYAEYDMALRRPDRIYIANPYDEYNSVTSVPPAVYTGALLRYTDELVYIPWFETGEFDKSDSRAYKNMRYYCLMPGVVRSDFVLVQSENIRSLYIDKLCEFAGEGTRDIWEKKIIVKKNECRDESDNESANDFVSAGKDSAESVKKILYIPDFAGLGGKSDSSVQKIRRTLEIFKRASADRGLMLVWHEQPTVNDYLKELYPNVYAEYVKVVDDFINEGWGIFDRFECENKDSGKVDSEETLVNFNAQYNKHLEKLVKSCSAYYGDGGRAAHMCRNYKKPVMIQNYDI